MKHRIALRTQVARVGACLVLLNFAVPGGALVTFGTPLREGVQKALADRAAAAKDWAARRAKSASRPLTEKEERTMQGRTGENPYFAGQAKRDVVYKGVDLMTGNYSTSATDMNFDGGYGIPVNVTRSYSANDADEGPFGKGWSLSADVRSTVGGLLKSGSAPVRAVPIGFKERPAAETDPNAENATGAPAQPVEAVIATDAGGTQETVQKDIDGVLTTPPWDTNVNENTRYEFVVGQNGQTYQVMVHNETVTAEGTRYVYEKKGTYLNGGTVPWNGGSTSGGGGDDDDDGPPAPVVPQPANVTKVVSATDRQGNLTTYGYGSNTFDYAKSNGTTRENPLVSVSMPGGHHIALTWGTDPSANAYGRIVKVDDGDGGRIVRYKYEQGSPGHGLLTSVTTPGGKTTSYGYGGADAAPDWRTPPVSTSALLTQVIAPNGISSVIHYQPVGGFYSDYYSRTMPLAVGVYRLDHSDGTFTSYSCSVGTVGIGFYQTFGDGDSYAADFKNDGSASYGTAIRLMHVFFKGNPASSLENLVWLTTENDNDESYYTATTKLDYYDQAQNDVVSVVGEGENGGDALGASRQMAHSYRSEPNTNVETDTSFNFLGNPLDKDSKFESGWAFGFGNGGNTTLYHRRTQYAYWGADKYFLQKAMRDPSGRYSFTDYYSSAAPAGKRGQTYRAYDSKHGGITLDPNAPIPTQTPPVSNDKRWRYQVTPAAGQYSAQFDYDPQGRPVDVWKLQKDTTSPWSYVRTHTSYGADGAPSWGQANQVVEDAGGIGRTTTTQAYTSWGKASDVIDAAGHEFATDFDLDGQVNAVRRVDGGQNQMVVSYTYGTSGIENGQPTQVADGLSGVTQTIAYTQSGAGLGQPASVTETNGNDAYTVSYTYNAAGDRETATYATPSGTVRWGYYDYRLVGDPLSESRVFQTMRRLDAAGRPTPEEFHYTYDIYGRLIDAAFAQTPAVGYTPQTGHSWYEGQLASTRARTHCEYDPDGHVSRIATYWDTWGQNGYTSKAILANQCDYEVATGLNRGLKTASRLYSQSASDPTQFALDRTETYGYDASLDQLTSANYGDGLPNATPTWSYDAAGNRNDAACDNLNRATSLGGISVTNDVLGNRLEKGGTTYEWDALNRLTALHGAVEASYAYRADGMRVSKVVGNNTLSPATLYRHDGQMGIEDVELTGRPTSRQATVTRYGLGARGVDLIERTDPQGNVVTAFPIYDAHGNNVASLTRSGASFSIGDRRSYDAWGVVRAQQSAGDPKLRYCANLGHKADDESGLIYMRARYYEPSSGRFVSEDPDKEGANYLSYCSNDPVNRLDNTGKLDEDSAAELARVIVRVLNNTPAIMKALGLAATWLVAKITKAAEKAALKAAAAALEDFADSMIQGGRQRFLSGAAEFAYGESAGDLSLAAGFGMSGIKDMIGGVAQMSAGITLKYMAMMLKWIS